MNLDELIANSGVIFLGKVTDKKTYYGDITTFDVLETLKGDGLGKTYEVKQVKIGSRPMASFSLGEQVLVFLYAPSSKGFSSPVGFEQGKVSVIVKEKLDESILRLNSFQKTHMFQRLSAQSARVVKSSSAQNTSEFTLKNLKTLIQLQRK